MHSKIISLDYDAIEVQTIQAVWLHQKNILLDVLRLDKIHNVVSGNKWFKLQYYLKQAKAEDKATIATFGGAWSNHIIATAFAAREAGLKSIGIIRGEKPAILSATLQQALDNEMELFHVTREQYRDKKALMNGFANEEYRWVNEGAFGGLGAKGAADILKTKDTSGYTHIVAAVGTGTMLAGLILSTNEVQQIIGISSMKGNVALEGQVQKLLPLTYERDYKIFHNYHFGGYAKHPTELINFINNAYHQYQLPLDIVYTGKTFFAIKDLAEKSFFKPGSRVLMIHSGGLQGNTSLSSKVLVF
jgi:1-aminocyclopropane-1-carboxylate deaminase/D-cysteine desulfhydrase-like pyridoxal-dependent ACC family enzyme